MESIEKLEAQIAGWLRPLPHLPTKGQKWFADNAWWMVVVSINFSIMGILAVISSIFTAIAFMNAVSSYSSIYSSYSSSSSYNGWIILVFLLVLSILIVNIILMALAVTPLQLSQKKGWNRLFRILLLNAILMLIGAISTWTLLGFVVVLIVGTIVASAGTYLLFETRSHFSSSSKN